MSFKSPMSANFIFTSFPSGPQKGTEREELSPSSSSPLVGSQIAAACLALIKEFDKTSYLLE